MTDTPPAKPRVRVTSPRTGEVYMASLLRAQLRLTVLVLLVLGLLLAGLPVVFATWPELVLVQVLGMPLPWVLLAFAVYPFLWVLAWVYVRAAAQRARLRRRGGEALMSPGLGVLAVCLVAVATLSVGAYGWRFSRTTSDFFVASRSVRPALNASAIGGEYLWPPPSSGWPARCSPSAPTCCGTRSAGRPATSCSWCWSPLRCAVRVPTPCRTSPRRAWSPGPCAASPPCSSWASAGST